MTETQASGDHEGWVSIGYLSRPHGLRGGVFLVADDRRKEFGAYTRVLLELRGQISERRVLSTYVSAGQPVLVLEGISSREEAEVLLRSRVSVLRSEAEAAGDDEGWLVADLVGLRVVDEERGEVGEVVAVLDFGAQENLEVKIPGRADTLLLPFIDEFVPEVDLEARVIRVRRVGEFLDEE